jgi:hypothetical protein
MPAEAATQRMPSRGKALDVTERDLGDVAWRYRRWARLDGAVIVDAGRPETEIAADVLCVVLNRAEGMRAAARSS